MAKRDIPKAYEPGSIEPRWAEKWVESELYTPEVAEKERPPDKPGFSLAIPPPNVTGSLHMGHMLEHTQIDILLRWRRMLGHRVLWLPGADHAGIATQVVVERQLKEEGKSRHELGREEFERRVWKWKEESGGAIKNQLVRLGASCDWTREHFTLEPKLYRAVLEAFLRLYREGLIYRGRYIINWCPRCHTALSDLEVEHSERDAKLYHLKYPVVGSDDHVVVATTRPETMLGDTAVAVHPEDERYQSLIGKKVLLPLMEREIPIVADDYVDREFGTGVVKITPAHDPNDFALGKRHNLEEIDVLDNDAAINENGGVYKGLDRFTARKKILADLEAKGLVEKIASHKHAVGACQRCNTLLEPKISQQWFCQMKPLAEPAHAAVQNGLIAIAPENRKKEYLDWMERIHDWCISRQLWWGHRIPVWHCADCSGLTPALDSDVDIVDGRARVAHPPQECSECGGKKLEQDPDVLDTWFSSALWPFSTLGWPDDTDDLKTFYPTTLMINGFDILFFWDARMVMMGLKLLQDIRPEEKDRVPFRQLYIHALVRDADRQKMSKTRGNVIDPLHITEQYGTDAVRFTLAVMAAPGTDITLSEDRIKSYRAFANKIWNASRFLFMNLEKVEIAQPAFDYLAGPEWRLKTPLWIPREDLPVVHRWIFSRLARVTSTVNDALKDFRYHEASHELYHFFWHDFCDWYIEWLKPKLTEEDSSNFENDWRNIFGVFDGALRLLHPFMPFITEELWHQLPQQPGHTSIALQPFPEGHGDWVDEEAEAQMNLLQESITALRNLRAEMKIDARKKIPGELSSPEPAAKKLFDDHREVILRLANLSELTVSGDSLPDEGGRLNHAARFDARLPFSETDIDDERKRLRKEKASLEKQLAGTNAKLGDDQFIAKAPGHVIDNIRQKKTELDSQYEKIAALLTRLEGRSEPPSSQGND